MIKTIDHDSLESITQKLHGKNLNLSLSKFVELNISLFQEIKGFVPLKIQAEIVSEAINKKVSSASLSVAISRLCSTSNQKSNIVIMEKQQSTRFVDKEAKLILGSQIEKEKIIKNGVMMGYRDITIDWRGLAPDESVSHWITEYKDKLTAINYTGWRWVQIAEAISKHLNREIKVNTLTSILCLSNKKQRNK